MANRAGRQLPEIPHCKPRVLAPDLDEAGKRQVVANENPGAGNESGRKRFVMRVAQTDHPAVAVGNNVPSRGHFEDAEVAVAFVADHVGLREQFESCVGELAQAS